jgi:hypothetical protein
MDKEASIRDFVIDLETIEKEWKGYIIKLKTTPVTIEGYWDCGEGNSYAANVYWDHPKTDTIYLDQALKAHEATINRFDWTSVGEELGFETKPSGPDTIKVGVSGSCTCPTHKLCEDCQEEYRHEMNQKYGIGNWNDPYK